MFDRTGIINILSDFGIHAHTLHHVTLYDWLNILANRINHARYIYIFNVQYEIFDIELTIHLLFFLKIILAAPSVCPELYS